MHISLMRHGIAEDSSPQGDAGRALTKEGRERTGKVARGLRSLGLNFDLILSSPLARARETAEIVAQEFNCPERMEITDKLAPGGSLSRVVEEINRQFPQRQDILLVGHEPDMSMHIATLCCGRTDAAIDMRRASFARLEADELRASRCAVLQMLLPPKVLAKLD